MKLRNFKQAEEFLALHIPKSSQTIFPGELGLERAKYFLKLLGNPQEKLKIIHVAGTSGKGSTCYLISSLLASQGFKVGLHQSPHLTDVTERFQINNQIISKKEFIFYLNKILPIIKKLDGLTYFEILVGLAYLIFYEKKVDYAVIETGLGGKYDGTNVVFRSDKLSVLTKIGLDHTNILGKTIEKIAFQKASIINEKSQVISIDQDLKAEKIIREVAEKKSAKLLFISRGLIYQTLIKHIGLIGDYQKENAALALATVNYLSQRDGFKLDKEKIIKVFETASFPGRFDIKKINKKKVIFDGAHNPQKMKAFIDSLIKKFPNKKFNFLIAFKKGKDYQDMLRIIIPWADSVVLTSFSTKDQDMINESVDPAEIKLNAKIIPDLKKAWKYILDKKEPIVVTGSLYLIGEIFKLIKNKQATNI
ncbi:MAG: Mur ligase family protein [Patescibacteria group bacterium]